MFAHSKLAALLTLLLASLGLPALLKAQDQGSAAATREIAAAQCLVPTNPQRIPPGLTAEDAAASESQPKGCRAEARRYKFSASGPLSGAFPASDSSSLSAPSVNLAQQAQSSSLVLSSKYPVTSRTGKWGGEEWEPAFLQTLGFTIAQNGYRLATEEKTRHALTLETWHRYYLAISGLHTWSDGGKTWTVYVAHPAQGAVFNDIWLEHDPHAALLYFGFNKPYWGERIKSFWWDSLWELQWKFGPFSEASIGNVGLVPGKLGANTIVSSAFIGTGVSVGEDMLDRYAIRHWEKHTDNRVARALLRSSLNPDRSFANLFRKKYPWYRDTRPTLRDLYTN